MEFSSQSKDAGITALCQSAQNQISTTQHFLPKYRTRNEGTDRPSSAQGARIEAPRDVGFVEKVRFGAFWVLFSPVRLPVLHIKLDARQGLAVALSVIPSPVNYC